MGRRGGGLLGVLGLLFGVLVLRGVIDFGHLDVWSGGFVVW